MDSSISRRWLLELTVGSICTGIAGCLDSDESNTEDSDSEEPDSEASQHGSDDRDLEIPDSPEEYPVTDSGNRSISDFHSGETYKDIDLGSRDGVDDAYGPHSVLVVNEAGVDEVDFGVIDVVENVIIHHETYAIPEGEKLVATLLEPSKYVLNVYVPEWEGKHSLRVPCSFFDCNGSSTRIGIFADGRINSSGLSTLIGCPSFTC